MANTLKSVESWLINEIAALCDAKPEELDTRTAFNRYLDSNSATALTARLANYLGRALPPTLFWDYPSIDKLSAHLGGREDVREHRHRAQPSLAAEPIAIVGMSCRFPGGANDPRQYWANLLDRTDSITEPPADRFNFAPGNPTSSTNDDSRPGGYLEDVFGFDEGFFNIKPAEAIQMDPQQRLMLELAWEGLEDAGIPSSTLRGEAVGVYMGAMWNEYHRAAWETTAHSATGGDNSIISARIAYFMGFSGPALTINTACSSSLVAVHTALQALRSGEIHTAVAGGVSLMLRRDSHEAMSRFGALSPNNRCAAFDANADGYARGEGAGLVVLKPLSHALRDGNSIYCVIRGGAVNNDGASNGLTAPSGRAQEEAIRRALQAADLTPDQVQYVEAHGTGTRLGDPIEAAALGAVYGAAPREPLRIGSVKSNLGHLEAAAGMAGLIKTALALHHRRLPPSLHFRAPNPHIDFRALRLQVQSEVSPWPETNEVPAAGVSSFGFGGTNAHLILRAFDENQGEIPLRAKPRSSPSAHTAFIFSGGGHQWPGMARDLLAGEPVFYDRVARCDEILSEFADWSLLRELISGENLRRTDITQPVLAAVQLGLADLHRARGIVPGAILGHSGGEPAAACFAGILSEEQAMEVAFHRGRLQARAGGLGGLVHAKLDAATAENFIESIPGLVIAAINSPRSLIFSGDNQALDELISRLHSGDAAPLRVRVDFPAHSPAMDELKEEFFQVLRHIRPTPGDIPLISPLDGTVVKGGECDAYYWARNLRDKVRFDLGVQTLLARGVTTMVEISAHPILARALQETDNALQVLPSLRRDESGLRVTAETWRAWSSHANQPSENTAPAPVYMFALSGPNANALRIRAEKTLHTLKHETAEFRDICRTSVLNREHLDHRWAAGARNSHELRARLRQFLDMPSETEGRIAFHKQPPLAFVFSGQGSEWVGMGRDLLSMEPEFRRSMRLCDEIFREYAGWSILEKLEPAQGERNMTDTAVVQACLLAVQTSLTALLRARGIVPHAVAGHSVGEIAAAHAAGILSLEDALKLVHHRGALMANPEFRGRMLEAEISEDDATKVMATLEGRVCVAARNTADTLVFSGDSGAMRMCRAHLRRLGIRSRLLRTRYAFHGPRMSTLRDSLRDELSFLKPEPGRLKYYSSVHGIRSSGLDLDAAYWGRNAADPVDFRGAMDAMLNDGLRVFLEISPRSVLAHSMRGIAAKRETTTLIAPLMRRGQSAPVSLTECMARLHCAGYPLKFSALFPGGGKLVRGNSYPWKRTSHRLRDRSAPTESPVHVPREEINRGVGFYQVQWRNRPEPETGNEPSRHPWIVFGDASGFGNELKKILEQRGEKVYPLAANDTGELRRVLEETSHPRILYPWSCGLAGNSGEGQSTLALPPLLHLARNLEGRSADLWIISAGLPEPSSDRADFEDPVQSAIWGLGRVLALELSGPRVRMVDLSRACADPDSALFRERVTRLLELVKNPGEDEQFLIGARTIRIPVLSESTPPPREAPPFKQGASYLITGGTGGIGRRLARKLLDLGAGRVVLASRQKTNSALLPELNDPRITFFKCDVGCPTQVKSLLRECGENLRGVFHAAGADKDHTTALAISPEDWEKSIRAKVHGIENLHAGTQGKPLDYFACFSSAAAVWGASGMAVYAAANAYLDAFMQKRRLLGLPGITINFSPWREVGMARDHAVEFQADGVHLVDPEDCLTAFFHLLNADLSHQIVAQLEARRFGGLMRSRGRGSFVAAIAPAPEDEETAAANESSELVARLNGLPADQREGYLTTYLADIVRMMLGAPDAALPEERGFFQLGLDSLMSVELQNRLRIAFAAPLSPTLVLEHPSLRSLTEYLLTRFARAPGTSEEKILDTVDEDLGPEEIPNVLEEATGLSDMEILNTLRNM